MDFSVPAGQTWEIEQISLNIGQGSTAGMVVAVAPRSDDILIASTFLGVSEVTDLDTLYEFVVTDFDFASPFRIGSGPYVIYYDYSTFGYPAITSSSDYVSFWDNDINEYRISGSIVPEPSSYAIFASLIVLSFILVRRSC